MSVGVMFHVKQALQDTSRTVVVALFHVKQVVMAWLITSPTLFHVKQGMRATH